MLCDDRLSCKLVEITFNVDGVFDGVGSQFAVSKPFVFDEFVLPQTRL